MNDICNRIAADLRAMADQMESIQDMDEITYGGIQLNCFVKDADGLATVGRRIGKFTKMSGDNYFWIRKKFPNGAEIDFVIAHDKICKRIEEKIVVPAKPERILPAEPEHEETVVKWECPESIFQGAESEVPA